MIDEIMTNAFLKATGFDVSKFSKSPEAFAEALTAIYEIGLECIGADEDPKMEYNRRRVGFNRKYLNPVQTVHNPRITVRNELKASQRKAWAKACGVAEK